MDHYDEELCDNLFFQTIQHSFSSILDLVSVSGWMILIPCKNSLGGIDLTLDNIESHVVKAQEDDPNEFYTLNKKELLIKSGIISTGKGFDSSRQVKVLFEELFYNNEGGSYRVLCISGPLQGGVLDEEQSRESDGELLKSKKAKIELSQLNFEDSCFHLWGHPNGSKTKHHLVKALDQLAKELSAGRGTSLKEITEMVKKTFELLVKFLVKTPPFKKSSSHYGMFLALETFIMHRIYRQLMKLIGVHIKESDTKLNKSTRNLTSLLVLEHLGINLIDISSLERSRIILNNFIRHITPSAKIYQLRKLFYSLLYSGTTINGNFAAMTSSELIPLCAHLITKSNVNNWWCHLLLMRNFCFSISHFDQELEYFLSTLEASMMYLMSEKVNPFDIWSELILSSEFSPDEIIPPIVNTMFQCLMENNLIGLEELKMKLENLKQEGDPSEMCHPLCSCPRCSGHTSLDGIRSIQQALQIHNEAGFTALHIACILGHHDIADWLLNNGSNVNEKGRYGCTPLHLACTMGSQVIVLLLLSHGADICSTDEQNNNALHIAAFHGHLQCVKALIFVDQASKKLDLDAVNNFLDTPLHIAARWGYEDICLFLLESGASGLKRNKQHLLPSDLAPNLTLCHLISKVFTDETRMDATLKRKHSLVIVRSDRIIHSRNSLQPHDEFNLIQSFSESSVSSPISSSFSSSASSKASQARKAKRLNTASPVGPCKSHASSDSTEKHNRINQLHDDIRDDDSFINVENLLHEKHSDSKNLYSATTSDNGGDYTDQIEVLLKACSEGSIDKVKSLLCWSEYEQDNPDAVSLDITKIKLCHPLCQCNKCVHVQWLSPINQRINQRININMTSSDGSSPLHMSCKNGHLELTHLLLMRGALVNSGATTQNYFPLHLACQQPHHQIVNLLIQYGADLNVVDGMGNTALHFCSLHHLFNHALLLVLFNAKVDMANVAGRTPLYNALRSSDIKMVFLLLLYGADIDKCPNIHLTSHMRCLLQESALIVKSLKSHLGPCHHPTSYFTLGLVESLCLFNLNDKRKKNDAEECRRSIQDGNLVQSLGAKVGCGLTKSRASLC